MAATLRASKQGLETIDQARKKNGWSASAAIWCDSAKTSAATLKRFRRGFPIQQDTFKAICEAVNIPNWESIIDQNFVASPTDTQAVYFAYDEAWVGRENLISDLNQKIQGNCRLLIIAGIAGIGKTALAERLFVELQSAWLGDELSKFVQENLDNQDQLLDFGSIAARLLEKCGQVVTLNERKDVQQLSKRLFKHLQENRYLIVMDSLERMLKANEIHRHNEFDDNNFLSFLQSILSSDSFQSRIILTSQEMPTQIPEIGTRYRNFWYCQLLSGLSEQEQTALFSKTGLDISPESPGRDYLTRIGKAYEGHPLALRVISGEIVNRPFYGNVVAYWNKYNNEILEVEKAIAEAKEGKTASSEDRWRLDRFTRTLQQNVRKRLQQTFDRLKQDFKFAYVLVCETSIYRCAVPEDWWLSHLEDWDCNEDDQLTALEVLSHRYLVEESTIEDTLHLRQHNLIRSVALEHLQSLVKDYE